MTGPPRLLSSAEGEIVSMLACLPGALVEAEPLLARTIAADLAPAASLVVVTHLRAAGRIARLAARRPHADVLACPDGVPLSPWCQDAVVAYDDVDGPLLAPSSPPGRGDPARNLADRLAAAGVRLRWPEGVPARGGNLLVFGGRVVVGADEWRRWGTEAGPDPSALFRTRIDATRRRLVLAGGDGRSPRPSVAIEGPDGTRWRQTAEPGMVERGSLQPAYHLDLYLALTSTPDGRPAAMVGDPRRAPPDRRPPPDRCDGFDAAAAALGAEGLEIRRCPMPLAAIDDARARRRHRVFASYTNALVEDGGPGRRRVWLPRFGRLGATDLSAADEEAAAAWAGLGLEVRPLDGLGALAAMAGGLHCAVRVLARTPRVAPGA